MLGVVLVAVCGQSWMADAAGGVARAGGGDDGGDDGPSRPRRGSRGNSFSGTYRMEESEESEEGDEAGMEGDEEPVVQLAVRAVGRPRRVNMHLPNVCVPPAKRRRTMVIN